MNYPYDLRTIQAATALRQYHADRQAKSHELLRLAGTEPQGWLSQQRCWLLCTLGRQLVKWGEQLKQYGLPEPQPLGTGMGGS